MSERDKRQGENPVELKEHTVSMSVKGKCQWPSCDFEDVSNQSGIIQYKPSVRGLKDPHNESILAREELRLLKLAWTELDKNHLEYSPGCPGMLKYTGHPKAAHK